MLVTKLKVGDKKRIESIGMWVKVIAVDRGSATVGLWRIDDPPVEKKLDNLPPALAQ